MQGHDELFDARLILVECRQSMLSSSSTRPSTLAQLSRSTARLIGTD